jgi:dihydroxyacetone kinase-like predicted kinase
LKVHVHTKKPESVIERLHSYGEFITLKIENMSIQHSDSYSYEKRKKNGLVAVCSGDGFEAVFRELGADRIISGGQANNPSTQDFLDAFDAIGAENIFVLPNNSNVIMVAEQAAKLYTKAFVFVIPSKNVGMGYAALSSYNEDVTDAGKIFENMKQSMKEICSGYVSWAVKSAEICGFHIAKGDIMGIIDKEIVSVSDNISDAVLGLVERLLSDEDRFMLTVFYGCEASEADLSILKNEIQERYPRIEIYSVHGGQRVYPYIFVAE